MIATSLAIVRTTMRCGTGHLIVGALLLAAGISVTLTSAETVWYGAIAVGAIESARGLYLLRRH